jgi:hypothetical protein
MKKEILLLLFAVTLLLLSLSCVVSACNLSAESKEEALTTEQIVIEEEVNSPETNIPETEIVIEETTLPEAEIVIEETALPEEETTIIEEETEIIAETQASVQTEAQIIPPVNPPSALYTENDIIVTARTLQGEAGCHWIPTAQKAAVVWCILNRYDNGGYASIANVCTAPGQFHGYWDYPYYPDQEMIDLVKDVFARWELEKTRTAQGDTTPVGRTLPSDYLYFHGDGKYNHFRKTYQGDGTYWNWSYPDPYAN